MPKSLLYLEQVGAGLIVMQRMGMSDRVETVSAVFPAQIPETALENL